MQKIWYRDILCIIVGTVLIALGLVVFTIPNHIAPGGISGLATAIAHVTGLSVGVLSMLMNVPLLIIGWWRLGFVPMVKTIVATILLSILIDVLPLYLPGYTNNPLLCAILGGVLCGAGMGLLFTRNISTGGTDLIGLLLRRSFPQVSMGKLMLLVDALVVLVAVCVFQDVDVALYSGVTIFCTSKVIDAIQQGVDYAKVIYIITERGEQMRKTLVDELERGVTLLDARGGFTGASKSVLLTVARRNEVATTIQIAKKVDPNAFIISFNATEVHGEGFKQTPS